MADWTNVPDSNLLPGKPAKSADFIAIKDNVTALAEGAVGAPRIQTAAFTVGSLGTTALQTDATAVAWVGSRSSSLALYSIGSYIFAVTELLPTIIPGATVAGSSIRPSNSATSSVKDYPSGAITLGGYGTGIIGTWRCMGYSPHFGSSSTHESTYATLWLRIS